MIMLFSYPEMVSSESRTINRLLEQHPDLTFHLRKPTWERSDYKDLIQSINSEFQPRIVIHQHHELMTSFALKGVHFTEKDRLSGKHHQQLISTSFHGINDAREGESNYEYFFCSPVFPSISKAGYTTNEVWNISNEPIHFREKAIALGGIDTTRLAAIRQRGFQHIAVLGAIWKSKDPEKTLNELFAHF